MPKNKLIYKIGFILDTLPYVLSNPQKMKNWACVTANLARAGDWAQLKHCIRRANEKSMAYKKASNWCPYKCIEVYQVQNNDMERINFGIEKETDIFISCPLQQCGECPGYAKDSGNCLLEDKNKNKLMKKQQQNIKALKMYWRNKGNLFAKIFDMSGDKEK